MGTGDTVDDEARWVTIDGRRWRASDPSIPPKLRQELVDALMAGRRAVAAAKRSGNATELTVARAEVHAAKVALGERGEPWWEEPSDDGLRARAVAVVGTLTRSRAPEGSICPSDVARVIGGTQWRSRMGLVREVAAGMAQRGLITVTQRGEPLDGNDWRGPVRFRRRESPTTHT